MLPTPGRAGLLARPPTHPPYQTKHKNQVRGYVRGKPLCVNQLVHLPGVGTFSMAQIRRCRLEPCPLRGGARKPQQGGEMMEEGRLG